MREQRSDDAWRSTEDHAAPLATLTLTASLLIFAAGSQAAEPSLTAQRAGGSPPPAEDLEKSPAFFNLQLERLPAMTQIVLGSEDRPLSAQLLSNAAAMNSQYFIGRVLRAVQRDAVKAGNTPPIHNVWELTVVADTTLIARWDHEPAYNRPEFGGLGPRTFRFFSLDFCGTPDSSQSCLIGAGSVKQYDGQLWGFAEYLPASELAKLKTDLSKPFVRRSYPEIFGK